MPSEIFPLKIEFCPSSIGDKIASLEIYKNDSETAFFIVPLYGEGIQPSVIPSNYSLNVASIGQGQGIITSTPSGINCGSDCLETYDEGTLVTLIATPEDSSIFTGWSDDCNGTDDCTLTINSDTNITATFKLKTFIITASVDLNGDIFPRGDIEIDYGSDKTFTITPHSGYIVDNIFIDGNSIGAINSYLFTNITENHSIYATFRTDNSTSTSITDPNQRVEEEEDVIHSDDSLPTAVISSLTLVPEGETVTLNASHSFDKGNNILTYKWSQIEGLSVWLSDPNSAKTTFVAPPTNSDIVLKFNLRVKNVNGFEDNDEVDITIKDNGIMDFISTFPNLTTIKCVTGKNIGINIEKGGGLTSLYSRDPNIISDTKNRPDNLIYGLIDMEIKVNNPGDTAIAIIHLPDAVPDEYRWFKYNDTKGWYDYSIHTHFFYGDKTSIFIHFVDGEAGDDDGTVNGKIKHFFGLSIDSSYSSLDGNSASSDDEDDGKKDGYFLEYLNCRIF